MSLRVSKEGYRPQQVTISSGPFEWIGLTGKHHGNYFLFAADHFEIKLEPGDDSAAVTRDPGPRAGPLPPRNSLGQFVSPTQATPTGSVTIASDPGGADIYIDGNFVGQTPSTVRLATGQHHVELKSQGRQSWTRELHVLKDSELTLHPALADTPSHP